MSHCPTRCGYSRSAILRAGAAAPLLAVLLAVGACERTDLPELQNISPERSLVINTTISPIRFDNTGEGKLTRCDVQPSLPEGLAVQPTADTLTCEIVGTPAVSTERTAYSVTGHNRRGTSTASITITVFASLLQPALVDANSEQSYSSGTAIDTFSFDNNGGESIISCTVQPALPAGLVLKPNSSNSTCTMFGMPTSATARRTYTVTAHNATGFSNADILITIGMGATTNTGAPAIRAPTIPILTQNRSITPIVFTNSGGSPQASNGCQSSPLLPNGLEIVRTTDGNSCQITGTPSITASNRNYEITARNSEGASAIMISLSVSAATGTEAPMLTAPTLSRIPSANQPLTPIIFPNSGGAPRDPGGCTISPMLPLNLTIGLTTNKDSCQITGTPLAAQQATPYNITATNDAGSGSVMFSLTIQ